MGDKVILRVEAGPTKGRLFEFDEHDTFVVGRSERCHVRIATDPFVSRHHYMIEIAPPYARLRDLGSLNGTLVNGKRYGAPSSKTGAQPASDPSCPEVDLAHGDRIQVGETVFVFELASMAATSDDLNAPGVVRSRERESALKLSKKPSSGPQSPAVPTMLDDCPKISGYTIEKEIGAGGMGVVYLARTADGGKEVAVKVLRSKSVVTSFIRDAFLREIELLRDLEHPQIASIIDSGSEGNLFYFVMHHYRGGSLDGMVRQANKPLRINVALQFILLALRGLEHAHQRGFVHRDIKPANLLLEKPIAESNVRVADFGLAKSFVKAGLSGMTFTGHLGGTPFFMPPEQITQFKYAKPISDVWAMGASLYFLLTTQPVRDALPGQDAIQTVLESPIVPIQERNPAIPKAVAEVINRSIVTDLNARYPTAKEFREALEKAGKQSQIR